MTGPHTAEGWVLKLGRDRKSLHHTELHVLLTLAARHNRDFQAAHPKIDLISQETHISVRQIQRILNSLADPERDGGQILHISYGPLPIESRSGHPVYGNVYRFIDFDDIPAQARPRRQLGGRPPSVKPDDTMSSQPRDTTSSQPDDTGDASQMTPASTPDDIRSTGQMTSVRSPLYPVKNPASAEGINPDLNPERARAQRPDWVGLQCYSCLSEIPRGTASILVDKTRTMCMPCDKSRGRARASPAGRV